jgi:hypothetical protein
LSQSGRLLGADVGWTYDLLWQLDDEFAVDVPHRLVSSEETRLEDELHNLYRGRIRLLERDRDEATEGDADGHESDVRWGAKQSEADVD